MKKLYLILYLLLLSNFTFGETKEELNSKTEFNKSLTAIPRPFPNFRQWRVFNNLKPIWMILLH
jgi:hypothetical protein